MTPTGAPRVPVRGFQDLIVWQRSYQLALECDAIANELQRKHRFVLADQLMRASISIPANIAEGHGRLSKADFARHLAIARGSARELDALLRIVSGLGLVADESLMPAAQYLDETSRMLSVMLRKSGARRLAPRPP